MQAKTAELFEGNDFIIMVGGTGLYIRAFTDGLDKIPEIDPLIRQRIAVNYQEKGINWLSEELVRRDLLFAMKGEMKNPQRMMRALEVVESTGRSLFSYRDEGRAPRNFNIIKFGTDVFKTQLNQQINDRVDGMFAQGLLEEARQLYPFKSLNALQTVGYSELFEFFAEHINFDLAVEKIKTNTRQYAKRQMTWFKKRPADTLATAGRHH